MFAASITYYCMEFALPVIKLILLATCSLRKVLSFCNCQEFAFADGMVLNLAHDCFLLVITII